MWLPQLEGVRRESLIRNWTRALLGILRVKVVVRGELPSASSQAAMLVANHISWLDIWAINAVMPVRFVAKSEVRDWPVIGWLSRRAGVIFIERAKRNDTARVSVEGAQALKRGDRICVFPEGTTSDGREVLPFRSSLLQSAVDADAQLCPLAIRYPLPDGGVNTAVAYTGEITMRQSLDAVLSQPALCVELCFLPSIPASRHDRRALAQMAWTAINDRLHPAGQAASETGGGLPA